MTERKVAVGTTMLFGVPAKPMPDIMANAIGQVVAQVPGIVEAYLPQCYIHGDDAARQVLVVGVTAKDQIPAIMQTLMGKMELVMPPKQFIDILPFPVEEMPREARVAECKVFGESVNPEHRRPWWKLW